jgi:hypothetical protein
MRSGNAARDFLAASRCPGNRFGLRINRLLYLIEASRAGARQAEDEASLSTGWVRMIDPDPRPLSGSVECGEIRCAWVSRNEKNLTDSLRA